MRRTAVWVALVGLFWGLAVFPSSVGAVATPTGSSVSPPPPHGAPHIMPIMHSGGRLKVASLPAGAHLTYYGGHVISNVQVIEVLYGSGTYTPEVSSTSTTSGTSMASFYTGVTNSSYFDWLSEYDTTIAGGTNQAIGRGSFVAQVQITPAAANNATTIDDSNIEAELKAQVTAGHLPPANGNTLYQLYFPAGKTITQGGGASGVNFCAYHGTTAGPELYYSVLPDFTAGGMANGCGNGTRFQNETSVSAHEMVEAVTDAEVGLANSYAPPLAWYDTANGEIGDICNGQQQAIAGGDGHSYNVQREFSNQQNSCVVTAPPLTNDFSLALAPTTLTMPVGGDSSSTVSTSLTLGSAGTVTLSATGQPSGVTVRFSPAAVTAGAGSTLTVSTTPSAPIGTSTFTVKGTEGPASHTATLILTINKAAPVITWATPAGLVYGAPLGATQLNAAANVPGTFAYSPAAGTVLHAGPAQALTAAFTPTDTGHFTSGTATVHITAAKAGLAVTADSKTRPVNQPNPALTASYSGLVNGDTPAALTGALQLTTPANQSSPAGNYPIVPSGLTSADYSITLNNGVLTVATDRALLISPADGQANVSSTGPFTWSTFAGAQGYYLVVGTTPSGYDLVNSGILPAGQSSITVPDLPTATTLYATLLTEVNGAWSRYHAVAFTAAPGHAAFTNPVDGQQNGSTTAPFSWSPIAGAQGYYLVVGRSPGGYDLVNSGVLPAGQSSITVPDLPTGTTLYATVLTEVNGAWSRYQAVAFTVAPGHAAFTNPVSGQLNVRTPASFTWSTVPGAQGYYLVVGTSPAGFDLVNTGVLAANQASFAVPALPTGVVLYATVLTEVNGSWSRYQVVGFTAG